MTRQKYRVGAVERGICGSCGMEDDLQKTINKGWFHNHCKGFTPRLQRVRKRERRIPAEAVYDFATGQFSLRDLAEKYGVGRTALIKRLRRAGLKNHDRSWRKPENRARRTHCARGHEFTDANTISLPDGYRACRACKRDRQRKWHQRRREGAAA